MVGDFVLALLLLGGGLLFLFLKSAQKDRSDESSKETRARHEFETAREEARKYQEGVGLVCLSCNTHFRSPLTEAGCPNCHLSSLVMTDTQFDAAQSASQNKK